MTANRKQAAPANVGTTKVVEVMVIDSQNEGGVDFTLNLPTSAIIKGLDGQSSKLLKKLIQLAFRTLVHRSKSWKSWKPEGVEGKSFPVTAEMFLASLADWSGRGEEGDKPNAADLKWAKAYVSDQQIDSLEKWELVNKAIFQAYKRELESMDETGLAIHAMLKRKAAASVL
jgi:hypothetical protein